ncbi:Miraculin [Hibiscus syriacus]|uniref:Miraculin n=1 Tax=Hibiscus syriacus TaxID=106335 RepID=A0A6A2ZKH8_HIBSY|nr:kunitz trypsin inhibitor 5-like [Hibiscus syriacus]KAE8692408.1 Miraculin [Hibiscus syriacus]
MRTALFLALSFILCASAAPDPVLDISGKILRTSTDYYILPVFRGRGGGLTLASSRNKTCPLDVVQEKLEVSNGLPVTFTPFNTKKGVIRVSTDNNIKFSAATICVQSTVWKLAEFDDSTRQWFVTSGGVEGKPGRETVGNWFKIEKHEDDYKLVFCPTVCDFCKVLCRDVGVFIDDAGVRRLALSDVPFKVMFKRA